VVMDHRSRTPRPFIHTSAKGKLLDLIEGKVSQLTAGQFDGVCGSTCTLAHGEKGIGKTEALRDAAQAVDKIFPTVVPVYAEYLGPPGGRGATSGPRSISLRPWPSEASGQTPIWKAVSLP
jgi:hypothetical protein